MTILFFVQNKTFPNRSGTMGKILVLYDSLTNCTAKMAMMVADGCRKVGDHDVRLRSVAEASFEDVVWADGLAVGTPTNLGGISWQMKKFWDSFAANHWSKVDGKLCCTFSSQGGHGGGAEMANMAMAVVLMNFGFLYFGVTDYVTKLQTLHYGACVAKEPRTPEAQLACNRLGLRLAEWVSVYVDNKKHLHPLLTTKKADPLDPSYDPQKKHLSLDNDHHHRIHIVVDKKVEKEHQLQWLAYAQDLIAASRAEKGCLSYEFVQSKEDPTRFFIVEEWESDEIVQKHFETPHFKRFVPLMDGISETNSVNMCRKALQPGAWDGEKELPVAATKNEEHPLLKGLLRKILIFTRALDYIHSSTPAAASFLSLLCHKKGYTPIVSDDPTYFQNPRKLDEFACVIFVGNSGQIFDASQENMTEYLASGGRVIGVHSALASFLDGKDAVGGTKLHPTTPLFHDVFGAHFLNHPPPQTGTILIHRDTAQTLMPNLASLPKRHTHHDEFFNFNANPAENKGVTVLASVEESSYEGGLMGHDSHPVFWTKDHGPGLAIYCSLGHFASHYNGDGNDLVQSFLDASVELACKR